MRKMSLDNHRTDKLIDVQVGESTASFSFFLTRAEAKKLGRLLVQLTCEHKHKKWKEPDMDFEWRIEFGGRCLDCGVDLDELDSDDPRLR